MSKRNITQANNAVYSWKATMRRTGLSPSYLLLILHTFTADQTLCMIISRVLCHIGMHNNIDIIPFGHGVQRIHFLFRSSQENLNIKQAGNIAWKSTSNEFLRKEFNIHDKRVGITHLWMAETTRCPCSPSVNSGVYVIYLVIVAEYCRCESFNLMWDLLCLYASFPIHNSDLILFWCLLSPTTVLS